MVEEIFSCLFESRDDLSSTVVISLNELNGLTVEREMIITAALCSILGRDPWVKKI